MKHDNLRKSLIKRYKELKKAKKNDLWAKNECCINIAMKMIKAEMEWIEVVLKKDFDVSIKLEFEYEEQFE